jgi:hypothetical protein
MLPRMVEHTSKDDSLLLLLSLKMSQMKFDRLAPGRRLQIRQRGNPEELLLDRKYPKSKMQYHWHLGTDPQYHQFGTSFRSRTCGPAQEVQGPLQQLGRYPH